MPSTSHLILYQKMYNCTDLQFKNFQFCDNWIGNVFSKLLRYKIKKLILFGRTIQKIQIRLFDFFSIPKFGISFFQLPYIYLLYKVTWLSCLYYIHNAPYVNLLNMMDRISSPAQPLLNCSPMKKEEEKKWCAMY